MSSLGVGAWLAAGMLLPYLVRGVLLLGLFAWDWWGDWRWRAAGKQVIELATQRHAVLAADCVEVGTETCTDLKRQLADKSQELSHEEEVLRETQAELLKARTRLAERDLADVGFSVSVKDEELKRLKAALADQSAANELCWERIRLLEKECALAQAAGLKGLALKAEHEYMRGTLAALAALAADGARCHPPAPVEIKGGTLAARVVTAIMESKDASSRDIADAAWDCAPAGGQSAGSGGSPS